MTNNNSNPISTFIAGQLPEFVRVDHPTLVAFLTSYYEWLDADNTYLRSPQKLGNVVDIDRTLDEFIANFKNEYLFGFPETMAVSDVTKKPVDAIKLMKNIKGFYRAKGTEKTYDFLFRILYDTSVEFYYPKNDILKLSDGKWVVRRSIKVGNNTGKTIYDSVGRTVIQRNDDGGILASARVLDVSTYRVGTNDISELFLGGVNGEFVSGNYGIEFADADGVVRKENRVFSVLGKITINDAGTGYKTGDRIIFTPAAGDTGVRAAGRVGEVDTNGKIRKFIIDNFGVNYKIAPTITVSSESGTGFTGSVSVGGVSEYAGYYANNDGRLSTNKVMQDNHFYQNYSYVILSEVTIDRYRDILKRLLNPAGLAFFGKVQIKRCAVADLQQSTSLFEYDVPIIGHYTPYTFITNDDLSPWFSDPYTGLLAGYDPTQHNKTIQNDLDENGTIDSGDISLSLLNGTTAEEYYKSIGNPVTFSREFMNPLVALKTAGFQNADPFWIIYQHPNRRIRGPVVARIPYDLKTEFLTDLGGRNQIGMTVTGQSTGTTGYWMEWTEASTANREEWSGGFTSGERYVMLNYNPLKDYTQSYYQPQTVSFAPNKSSLVQPGKLLPIFYYDNVFTYAGQKNFEKLSSDNSNESQLLSTNPSNAGKAVNFDIPAQYEFSADGKNVIGILPPSQATIQTGGLSDTTKNYLSQDPNKLLTTPAVVPPPLSYNHFAYWDSATSSHYLTYRSVTGGYGLPCNNCKETGHLGISGLTATTKEAVSKMVRSLRGEIRPDWNGISGGGWDNLNPFPADYTGLISMNTESWDALFSESEGIADPDNPNSVGNFIRDKILIPMFVGGVSPDGTTFGGLQENFPNAIFANYGHPGVAPRNIQNYYGYPGFRGRGEFARGSIGETLTLPSGLTYTSYAPSATCPTCVWDGRIVLHSLDPNRVVGQASVEARRNLYSTVYPNQAVENTEFSKKLHKEKWYPFCKAVSGWQPSFYTATRDLVFEKFIASQTISMLSSWKSQIFQEQSDAGIEPTKKYILPFISNKAFTQGTGDGGYARGLTYGAYITSVQDLSYYTPNQFVDLYIAPSLSGQSKGAVDGFYMWTGEQTYACQFGLGISIENPQTVEVMDANGNVIDWKKNPFTLGHGYEPYWDWNTAFGRPGAPTGGSHIVGKNGTARVSWRIAGGQFNDGDPWQGGDISPTWPTSSSPLPLETSSLMYHCRKNLVAYQAFLDGVTGQYAAQYNYLEPHKYSYLSSTFPTWFVPDTDNPAVKVLDWSRLREWNFRVKKTSNDGRWTIPMGMVPGTTFAFNHRDTRPADDKRPTNPVRKRAGVGVTGAIISNPLFNSLTGSSTVFSYSDGNSYKDKGWNTADRIGYVKAVRSVPNKPNEVEIAVEPYFFVGGPIFGQYEGADSSMWFSSTTVNYDGIPPYENRDRDLMMMDGITHGMTSGNAPYPTSMGVPNPVGTFAELAKISANTDPSPTNQRPKWGHIFTPGDIISFGAVGATFELVTYGQASGNFQRTTAAEVDHVWSMIDNMGASQWSAALTYWNGLYNTGLDGDFSIQFNAIENAWNVYGPGNRNIINGWKPKTTPTSCSSAEIAPSISVAQNDADNSLEISYAYNNTCTTEKYMAWPDLPPMDLGESVSYFDTRINAGSFGSGVGAFIDLDKNSRLFSSNYPSQLYSPIHLAKTKFSGECCVDNNFAVSVALTEYSPSDDNHEISLVAFPPQDAPSVILAQQGNAFYKAYQDRFSFQIATWNESQITQNGQAKLAAGQSKTYKVIIKFAKIPPVAGFQANLIGMGSIGIGTDSAAVIETLTPYKEFLDRRYPPQTYIPDYRPVRGIPLALEHLIEPSPTASNYNPYGWDKNSVNYTLVGGYPNTIGYTGVAAYIKDQLENKGWDRAMIWTPSGLSYKIGANYPPRSVTHWTEPNRVYTSPTGVTSSITNNMDNAETIMKTMVDALDDTKQVGFWLGNSIYSNIEFDNSNLYPMGSTGFDVTILQNNLSIVDNITNNTRGISKGIAGLDAWNKFSAVSPSTVDNYSLITTVSHPSIKYVTEGRACDYLHRMNPTYIDFYSPSGITQVDSSFGLANYFTPDHETWIGMNFSNSIDLVVRGSSGCAHEIKMARGPIIKSVIDMGLIPVVFEPIEQDYIYGGTLTETGNCSCTGCACCQNGCYTVQGIYDCQGCSGCFGCTGCGVTGATCSGALCCGLLANGTQCFNTFYGIYDCAGCSGYGGCTGCEVTPTDPCESCSYGVPCVNVWTGQLDCQGCSGCYGCTGCGQTAGATGCALCSSTNLGYTVQGIYDCKGCSGCHGFTGCSRGATGATGCNLCRADLPCYTLAGIYDCAGCSGCFGCDGCTTIAPCVGCQCCMTGGYNRVTGLKDCIGCSGCFGFTGCGMTGTTGSTGCSGSGGTACCGTTGNGTLCFNIVTGMYDCLGCSGFNGCTGCGMTASLTGCALCSPTNPCFTVNGIYDCKGCSGCHGCIGCSVTGPTSCTGCGCCSSSTTGACFNIVTGFYDCVGCSGCASCTGCGRTASVPCQKCMTGGYNRVTGLKDCIGCSGCFGFTGCGVTAPATGCARCSQIDPCYTTNIPSAYDCVGCSGCWQCTGCSVIEPSCTGANCCGITANGTQCWNTFIGIYDCKGCSGYGGCTGCGITGVSAGPTGCAVCSTWLDLPCYNTVTGIYDCKGCSGCAGCTGCGITGATGCTGCGCCSEIYDCFNITGGYDCVGCSGCYNCGGCDQRYSLCSQCTTGDCGITSSANHQFCVDCGCSNIYSNCNQCTQLDCDDVSSVNNQFCKTCGCVSEVVDCAECLRLNCNGILCRTQCPDCYGGGGDGKYTNCNECLQGDCDFDTSINHDFCLGCGCQQRYTLCNQCTQNECNDQFNINHEFCYECGCTSTQDCNACVAGGCVGDGCDLCVNCNTQEPYQNCSQCVPADCVYAYRLNHTYCKETCGCNANGGTGGETGGISEFLNIGKEIAYSDFRKVTIRSFLTMPVGPEFDCKNSDVQPPPVPQVKATTINGVYVDRADWSTDSNNIVGSLPNNKSIYIDVTGVISETGSSAGLSTMLYLSYYAAISMWADLFIVDSTGKEYQMASVGPMATSANTVKITFPFINPQHPLSEPGAVSLGRGVFGGSFAYQGIQIPNNNCIYRLKIYFRNTSNAVIAGSTTIKEFNYQLI